MCHAFLFIYLSSQPTSSMTFLKHPTHCDTCLVYKVLMDPFHSAQNKGPKVSLASLGKNEKIACPVYGTV